MPVFVATGAVQRYHDRTTPVRIREFNQNAGNTLALLRREGEIDPRHTVAGGQLFDLRGKGSPRSINQLEKILARIRRSQRTGDEEGEEKREAVLCAKHRLICLISIVGLGKASYF